MCSRNIKEGDIIEEHNYRTSQNKVGVMVVAVTNRSQDGIVGGGLYSPLLLAEPLLPRNFHVILLSSGFLSQARNPPIRHTKLYFHRQLNYIQIALGVKGLI